jgi:hypothetical protein
METINILAKVHEGMTVYDYNGDSIGTVSFVQMTDELPGQPGPETAGETASESIYDDSFIEDVAEVFTGESDLPDELRSKLLHEGYIRIDIGILRSDRFATADQVASVSDEEVHLNVDADSLIKHQ